MKYRCGYVMLLSVMLPGGMLFGSAELRAESQAVIELTQYFADQPEGWGMAQLGGDPFGAESLSAEDDQPRIPEPMVFDLVRALGARQGELEVNVLTLIPLNRRAGLNRIPDPIGIVPDNGHHTEWAPEVEYALWDGFALEFELPFEETRLEAYKLAAQWTFGTAFNNRLIHGTQGILFYDRDTGNWSPTLLYIAGVQFDEYWSALGMFGFQTEINSDDAADRTQQLLNFSLFHHLTENTTLGFETNFAQSMSGNSSWLMMPQLHWEISDYWMFQGGAGVSFSQFYSLPMAGMRLIREF